MFGSSKPIARFIGPFGIPVQIDGSLIFLALIFLYLGGGSLIYTAGFVAMLVGSIFLHELGHAWGCRVQGIAVRRIVLHGGGGFCEHAQSVSPRAQELIVAMGPIVNLTIWALASLAAHYVTAGIAAWALYWLALMNLFLAIFNMVPVQPLDGGKLLQLGLMRVMSTRLATRIAGGIGLVLAVLWIPGMIWLYFNVGLVLFFFPPIRLHLQMLRLK